MANNDDGSRINRQLTRKHYYYIIHHIGNTYREGSELAMSLAEIFRNEGKTEGKTALTNTAIRLITKFVAPPSEDIKQKIHK
ncbi:hypothetical protein [Oceanobacillus sp. FSL W7-1293]|uniref:hypothetical protein n=1 Tax=Oceanobacillus sp. FSL W7-1293 TaxID=2921699 RepID=UPI0030D60D1D